MSRMKMAAALAAMALAQVASAQQAAELPYVGNVDQANVVEPASQPRAGSRPAAKVQERSYRQDDASARAERLASRVESRLDRLSMGETEMLDQISSGAAARAVLALRCEGARFERVSKAIQDSMETKADQVSQNSKAARAYARDSALTKYKAMAHANMGAQCADLDNLRHISASQGFE